MIPHIDWWSRHVVVASLYPSLFLLTKYEIVLLGLRDGWSYETYTVLTKEERIRVYHPTSVLLQTLQFLALLAWFHSFMNKPVMLRLLTGFHPPPLLSDFLFYHVSRTQVQARSRIP